MSQLHGRSAAVVEAVPDLAAACFALAGDALLVVDTDGRVLDANRRFVERSGRDAAQLVGRALASLLHPSADDAARRALAAVSGLAGTLDLPLARGDGSVWPVRLRAGGFVAADGSRRHLIVLAEPPDAAPAQAALDDGWAVGLARSAGETEAALKLALDAGRIGVYRVDLAARHLHFDDRALAVLRLPPQPEGMRVADFALLHPDDMPAILRADEQALASSGPVDAQLRMTLPGGDVCHLFSRRVAQRDAAGVPIDLIGVLLDVSGPMEQAQRALDLARSLELTTAALGIGLWSFDPATDTPVWNAQMWSIFGLEPRARPPSFAEWLAQCVHPDDRERVRRRIGDWVRSGASSLEQEYRIVRCDDGRERWIADTARCEPRGDGDRAPTYGISRDVTEQHAAEAALRRANARVALVAAGAGLGTYEVDADTGHELWDEQMFTLRGTTRAAVEPYDDAGRHALTHEDDRARVLALQREAFATGEPRSFEFRVVARDGSTRWLAARVSPVVEDGKVVRLLGLNWDVTETHAAREALLDREVALRESRAKWQFLARMSHELRTPLNAVLGFTQLLAADLRQAPSATAKLEHVRAAGEHLLSLINDALDLGKLESGQLPLQPQAVSLAALTREAVSMVQPLARSRGIELHLAQLAGATWADRVRLRQVLINLLSNAIKYNRPRGRVLIDASRDGERVRLAIADTGRGLSEAQLARVFEPFNRVGAEDSAVEGSGIGLAIAKALVERMGGAIGVQSEPGVGSVFTLDLAAADEPDDDEPPRSRPFRLTAPGELRERGRVLYIEDNPVNVLLVEELLRTRTALEIASAPDGASGVARAIEELPDLILLDMQLPDFDGFEVLRRLRAHPATAAIRCIAVSANALPEDIERALAAGFADYWTKPLDLNRFARSLDALFNR